MTLEVRNNDQEIDHRYLAGASASYRCWRYCQIYRYPSTIYRFPSEQIGVLSETEAVTITRRAIESSGRNPDEFAALAWGTREFEGKSEQTFARNTLTPNGGYVIWKHASGDPAKTVHVHIEKHDESCECIVSKVK